MVHLIFIALTSLRRLVTALYTNADNVFHPPNVNRVLRFLNVGFTSFIRGKFYRYFKVLLRDTSRNSPDGKQSPPLTRNISCIRDASSRKSTG